MVFFFIIKVIKCVLAQTPLETEFISSVPLSDSSFVAICLSVPRTHSSKMCPPPPILSPLSLSLYHIHTVLSRTHSSKIIWEKSHLMADCLIPWGFMSSQRQHLIYVSKLTPFPKLKCSEEELAVLLLCWELVASCLLLLGSRKSLKVLPQTFYLNQLLGRLCSIKC